MNRKPSTKNLRHPLGAVSSTVINHLHLRNPWVTAFWSVTFPGVGHIIMCCYVKGFLLIIWEIFVNVQSNLNLAILYSFTGDYEKAKQVADTRWLLLYCAVYIYAIWDSYRKTVDMNKLAILAQREGAPMVPVKISPLEINFLDKRNPWMAATWSMLSPGLGHLYTYLLPAGFFVLTWWIIIAYQSHLLEAIQYSFCGDFAQAIVILNPEWVMFIPSLYGFSIFDAYINTVEYNKLFKREQAAFLKENYQHPDVEMPV